MTKGKPLTFDSDMPRRLPLHVTRERTRHGKAVYYFRLGKGERIRLPDYGSPQFQDAYSAALRGEPFALDRRPNEGTLGWLILQYQESLGFRTLAPITQRNRRRVFDVLNQERGSVRLSSVTEQTIINGREKRATGRGHSANMFLKAVKPLFAYAKTRGWMRVDPAKNVGKVKTAGGGYHTWTVEEVQQFVRRHPKGTKAYLALCIYLFTGLRREDVAILGRQHRKGNTLRIMPHKTARSSGVVVEIPILPALQEALETAEPGRLTYVTKEDGMPYKPSTFGMWFGKMCRQAGVTGQGHGLRKAGATIAAQNGATVHQLMAIYGWTTTRQAEVYTREASRTQMAADAMATIRIDLEPKEEQVAPHQKQGAGTGTKV